MPIPEHQSYTIEGVQDVLKLGRTAIYKLLNTGQLKARKVGRRTVIMRSDLDAFLSGLENYPTGSKA